MRLGGLELKLKVVKELHCYECLSDSGVQDIWQMSRMLCKCNSKTLFKTNKQKTHFKLSLLTSYKELTWIDKNKTKQNPTNF